MQIADVPDSTPAGGESTTLEELEELDGDEESTEGSDVSVTDHPIPDDAQSFSTPHEDEDRQAKRIRKQPVWMNDYTGHLAASLTVGESSNGSPPTFPYVISHGLTSAYTEFLFNLTAVQEPGSYKEASSCKEWI